MSTYYVPDAVLSAFIYITSLLIGFSPNFWGRFSYCAYFVEEDN